MAPYSLHTLDMDIDCMHEEAEMTAPYTIVRVLRSFIVTKVVLSLSVHVPGRGPLRDCESFANLRLQL